MVSLVRFRPRPIMTPSCINMQPTGTSPALYASCAYLLFSPQKKEKNKFEVQNSGTSKKEKFNKNKKKGTQKYLEY